MNKRFKLDSRYLNWGITAFLVIVCSITFFLVLSEWPAVKTIIRTILNVLAPVIYGLMFAYLFGKLMTLLEKKLISRLTERIYRSRMNIPESIKNRTTRIISVLLTMLLVLLVLGGTLTLILPQLYYSLISLVYVLPGYFDTAVNWLNEVLKNNSLLGSAAVNLVDNIGEQITTWIQTALLSQANMIISNFVGGVIGVIKVIANLLIGLVISVYVMYHKERFAAQSKKLVYSVFKTKRANGIIAGARFLDKTCGSFITSRLIDALIVGIVTYIAMIVLKMPYPMLIAAMIGITNIIPFFGPFMGGIPSAVLILLADPSKGLIFVIFIIVLQQLDGNVLYPKIQGSSIGLSGFWIIFSLLFFGGLFSFWGMLLGVPVFAVIYSVVKGLGDVRLRSRGLPADTDIYKAIDYVDEDTGEPVLHRNCTVPDNFNENGGETYDDPDSAQDD